jgi:hypothetical protein
MRELDLFPIAGLKTEAPGIFRHGAPHLLSRTVGKLSRNIDFDVDRRIWIGRQHGNNFVCKLD